MRVIISVFLVFSFLLNVAYSGHVQWTSYEAQSDTISFKKSKGLEDSFHAKTNDLGVLIIMEETIEEEVDEIYSDMLFAILYCFNLDVEFLSKIAINYGDFSHFIDIEPLFLKYCSLKIPFLS